jgi:hypothetical protein
MWKVLNKRAWLSALSVLTLHPDVDLSLTWLPLVTHNFVIPLWPLPALAVTQVSCPDESVQSESNPGIYIPISQSCRFGRWILVPRHSFSLELFGVVTLSRSVARMFKRPFHEICPSTLKLTIQHFPQAPTTTCHPLCSYRYNKRMRCASSPSAYKLFLLFICCVI